MISLDNLLGEVAAVQCPPETKKKLMDAAIHCVKARGFDKTSLNHIAREAGCARQTVYNYYPNRDAVILAALLESAAQFSDRLIAHIAVFQTTEEQIVEGLMYCLEQLPNEPYLQLITDASISSLLNTEVFNSEICLGSINKCALQCLQSSPELLPYADEIGESMTRLVLSLLSIDGPKKRDGVEMRAYIRRRFLPGLVQIC